MSASTLLRFNRELCEYALGQVRSHLLGFPRERTPPDLLHPGDYDHLALGEWVSWAVSSLPAKLGDRVWAGVGEELPGKRLSVDELYDLAGAFDDPPLRLEQEAVWLPCERTHARYVTCLPVIHNWLGGPVADEWSSTSLAFAAHLTRPLLPLAEGFAVVCDWTRRLRQLARMVREAEAIGGKPARQDSGSGYRRSETPVCDWREAMAVTGLKKTKLYDLFRDGRLKGFRDGGMIRFYRTGLMSYMKEQEVATVPPATPVPPRKPSARAAATGTRFKFL